MIIAISSKGSDLDSLVDERFGRANYFIIYDTEANRFEALDNEMNAKSSQGVGVKAVELLSGKDSTAARGTRGRGRIPNATTNAAPTRQPHQSRRPNRMTPALPAPRHHSE